MFFSANLDYPKKLEKTGMNEQDTFYAYEQGKIVIANTSHAPYGQAAVAAIKKENVYDKVADKFVMGENISQTASFATSGAADVGIVAMSLALSPNMKDKGRCVE